MTSLSNHSTKSKFQASIHSPHRTGPQAGSKAEIGMMIEEATEMRIIASLTPPTPGP